MKERLKRKYNLSDYQIAQLVFLIKSIASEAVKLLLMGIFFWRSIPEYLFAVVVLLCMRTSTGGLHCKHFITCFFTSFLFLLLAVYPLPAIPVPKIIQLSGLLICILCNYYIGPITGPLHKKLDAQNTSKSKVRSFIFIFLFLVTTYIIPENNYISIGFWVIVLHTIQLIIAKVANNVQDKRRKTYEKLPET